jgi:hypothetical protein
MEQASISTQAHSSSIQGKEETKNEEKKEDLAIKDPRYPNVCRFFKPKPFTDHTKTKLGQIAKPIDVTPIELL